MSMKLKKFLSLLISVTMIMAVMIPVNAESELSTQISIVFAEHSDENPGLNANWGGVGALGADSASPISVTATFMVSETGWYDAEFIAAACTDANFGSGRVSPINYRFNDEEFVPLVAAGISNNPTVETINTAPLSNGWFTTTKLLNSVYLTQGENKIEFITTGYSGSDATKHKAGFYSCKLTKVDEDNISIIFAEQSKLNPNMNTNYANVGALGTDSTSPINVSAEFTVYKEGWYDVELVAAAASSSGYGPGRMSPVDFWFNDEEKAHLADSSISAEPTVTTIDTAPLSSGWFTKTSLIMPVYLEAGTNTLNFVTTNYSGSDPVNHRVAFHSCNLSRMEDGTISEDSAHILFSRDADNLTMYNTNYANVGALGTDSTSPISVSAEFTVYKEGWYDVELVAATASSSGYGPGRMSPVDYWFNDEEKAHLADSSISSEPTVTTIDTAPLSSGWFTKTKLIEPVYLRKGTNTINFVTTNYSGSDPAKHRVAFYSCDLSIIEDISELNDITIYGSECNQIFDGTKYLTAETNRKNLVHGNNIMISNGIWDENVDEYTLTIPFRVYTDGAYNVELKMLAYAQLPISAYGWEAPVYISVDGSEGVWLKDFATDVNSVVSVTTTEKDLSNEFDWHAGSWGTYRLNAPLILAAGKHEIVLSIPAPTPNETPGRVRFGIDNIHISPVGESSKIVFEGECMQIKDNSEVVEADAYSAGKALRIRQASTVEIPFYVSKTGNYNLGFITAGNIQNCENATKMSQGTYQIDYGTVYNLKDGEGVKTIVDDLSDSYGLEANQWGKYKAAEALYLEEGNHVLTFSVEAGDFYIDNITISEMQNVTSIDIQADNVVKKGAISKINILNQDGNQVGDYDVDMLSYESSNSNIVSVNGDGMFVAHNYGEATITACVLSNGKSISDQIKVYVVGEDEIYISSSDVNGNNVTVTVCAEKSVSKAVVLVALYDKSNGIATSFKTVKMTELTNIPSNADIKKTFEFDSISNDDGICAFIWNDISNITPLYGKTVIR